MTLSENRAFVDIIKTRLYKVRMGPKSNDWYYYQERERFGDPRRRQSCKDKGKYWRYAATNQETPRLLTTTRRKQRGMAESGEEQKSLLKRVQEESEKPGLKLNIQKTKITASCSVKIKANIGVTLRQTKKHQDC